jgi:hypothetical protein
MVTHLVGVGRPPVHDVAISLNLDRTSVRPGDNITVTAIVTDLGTYSETYNLSISYGPPTIALRNYTNQTLSPLYLRNSVSVTNKLNTRGLSVATYEVDAVIIAYFSNNGTITSQDTAKKTFAILVQQDSPLPYIAATAVGLVAALGVIRFVLKRRRTPED